MGLLALLLLLLAAFVHATWNLLAKRAGGGVALTWLFEALAALLYLPVAAASAMLHKPRVGGAEAGFVLGSAVLHLGYFLALQRAYRTGDLSVVYPLARGTGPFLATLAAIALFGERPTPLALTGALLIVGSLLGLVGGELPRRRTSVDRSALGYGVLTGAFIAGYTLWDKHAVSTLGIPPILLDWGSHLGRCLLLTPLIRTRWPEVIRHWRVHRVEVLGLAVLVPLSYLLVLTALRFSPVSAIAPAREVSILVGAWLGTRVLAEQEAWRRLLVACGMTTGVILLVVG
ncbi:MAG: EamA family transporter [Armatimonadota bacterium]|nr:EamA family transporter [Armatimonadota bacterium]MDR7602057.1 EamA family transporter [Armatimonadota bacterium]